MSQNIRQTHLFSAEDWTIVYESFKQVNFTSYDFDSIRAAMIEYVRLNYPEEFNDWIESSEFVAIIDLIAYLGQSLAFRIDLSSRENFLDTAESRNSVIRLARMLSYDVQRNYPGSGLVKIVSVMTTEALIDSENRNLSGIPIDWNSQSNSDWLEQFILILNAAFSTSNEFGFPIKKGLVSNISTEIYELNNILGVDVIYPFTVNISGQNLSFELVSADFKDMESFHEAEPNPYTSFNIVYQNDKQGNDSKNNGFFMIAKQGHLQFNDFNFSVPVENRILNINAKNVNQTDVWLQEINKSGFVRNNWKKVPTVAPSSNIIYNALDRFERNIFTVLTHDDDKISYRFSDGRFGNVPSGTFRAWYRTSNGLSYIVAPEDIQNYSVSIPYRNLLGQEHKLMLTFSLQTPISNSQPTESINSIKQHAPHVYYTQDRMVNGEDYNILPLVQSAAALKIKAVNRTYSGHSRYININDPTGATQNTNIFSDDGIFYKETDLKISEITRSASTTFRQIIANTISPLISSSEMKNFTTSEGVVADSFDINFSQRIFWKNVTQHPMGSTGYFEQNNNIRQIGVDHLAPYAYMDAGAMINLVKASDPETEGVWIKIEKVEDNGDGLNSNGFGTVTINERLEDFVWIVRKVIPSFNTVFRENEKDDIIRQISLKNTFGLGYDYKLRKWYIIKAQDVAKVSDTYDLQFAGNQTGANRDASWLVRIEYTATSWKFYTREISYIWESVKDVRFFNSSNYIIRDGETGNVVKDLIKILEVNKKPNSSDIFETDHYMQVDKNYIYPDGYIEPRRIKVTMRDVDKDGTFDDPEVFEKVVGDGIYIFWKKIISLDGYEYLEPIELTKDKWRTEVPTVDNPGSLVDKDLVFVYSELDAKKGSFYQYSKLAHEWKNVSSNFTFNAQGRKGIRFQWKHFVSREDRVDPSLSNIIDIFALTTAYDTDMRNWILSGGAKNTEPLPPDSDEIRQTFHNLESFKMISDQIIWRSAKYKILFGEQANEELRAQFKIVKVKGSFVTDNEIKSRTITAINEFFNINNWDFGETFYFTELSSFIHQRLASIAASVVIVPLNNESAFGNLFQIKSEANELFISSAKITDVQIVDNLTVTNLRIGA